MAHVVSWSNSLKQSCYPWIAPSQPTHFHAPTQGSDHAKLSSDFECAAPIRTIYTLSLRFSLAVRPLPPSNFHLVQHPVLVATLSPRLPLPSKAPSFCVSLTISSTFPASQFSRKSHSLRPLIIALIPPVTDCRLFNPAE